MKNSTGKVALVTGGSRGIGAAIVERLAAEGIKVAFTYQQSAEKAGEIVRRIEKNGGVALAIQADSADATAISDAVDQTVKAYGTVNVLVSNAGVYLGKDFGEHSLADYEKIMAINVRAVFAASLAASKHMQEGDRIISIGSNMGDNAVSAQTTLYTMSKSALQGFTRGLARDLGSKKITVNLVQPGPVDTDMNPADTDHAAEAKKRSALGHYGEPKDIAALVSFLAGSEASYITGSILTIDGGFNA